MKNKKAGNLTSAATASREFLKQSL